MCYVPFFCLFGCVGWFQVDLVWWVVTVGGFFLFAAPLVVILASVVIVPST